MNIASETKSGSAHAVALDRESMEAGLQPLDALMGQLGLNNNALVGASGEYLTHKEVQKARRGRRLTGRMQSKIARALGLAAGRSFTTDELFNYRGR